MSDLIERQAAIDAVNELTRWYYETFHEKRPTANAVIDKLMELPSAEPRCIATIQLSQEQVDEAFEKVKADILSVMPKTGKWIYSYSDRVCSVCHASFDDEIVYMCKEGLLAYCPNCGAKMEIEEEDEEEDE